MPATYECELPAGVRPGERFTVTLPIGQVVEVQCPPSGRPADRYFIRPFEVTVPAGVRENQRWTAMVNGLPVTLRRPRDVNEGQTFTTYLPVFPDHQPDSLQSSHSSTWDPSVLESKVKEMHAKGLGFPPELLEKALRIELQNIPSEFLCSITNEIMFDPVLTIDGFTYEREAIEKWLSKNVTSPKTCEPLPSKIIIPNRAIRARIIEFVEKYNPKPAASKQQSVSSTVPQLDEDIPEFGAVSLTVDTIFLDFDDRPRSVYDLTSIVEAFEAVGVEANQQMRWGLKFKVLDGTVSELVLQLDGASIEEMKSTSIRYELGSFVSRSKPYEWISPTGVAPEVPGKWNWNVSLTDLYGHQHLRKAIPTVVKPAVPALRVQLRTLWVEADGHLLRTYDISTDAGCEDMTSDSFGLRAGCLYRYGGTYEVLSGDPTPLVCKLRCKQTSTPSVKVMTLPLGPPAAQPDSANEQIFSWQSDEIEVPDTAESIGHYIAAIEFSDGQGTRFLVCAQQYQVIPAHVLPTPRSTRQPSFQEPLESQAMVQDHDTPVGSEVGSEPPDASPGRGSPAPEPNHVESMTVPSPSAPVLEAGDSREEGGVVPDLTTPHHRSAPSDRSSIRSSSDTGMRLRLDALQLQPQRQRFSAPGGVGEDSEDSEAGDAPEGVHRRASAPELPPPTPAPHTGPALQQSPPELGPPAAPTSFSEPAQPMVVFKRMFVEPEGRTRIVFDLSSTDAISRMADHAFTLKDGTLYRHGFVFRVLGAKIEGLKCHIRTMRMGASSLCASHIMHLGTFEPKSGSYKAISPPLKTPQGEENLGHYVSAIDFADASGRQYLVCAQQFVIDTEWL